MISIVTSTVSDGNMSYKFGTREAVEENRRRFFAKNGINPHRIVYVQQVHGARIGVVRRPQTRSKTDGLITKTPNLWLAAYHADCIPLFYSTDDTIGLAHVGWKGVVAGLPAKMVGEMVKHFKIAPRDINVKCGPFICKDHYDLALGDERLKKLPHEIKGGRAYVDLFQALRDQLLTVGLLATSIQEPATMDCTAENSRYWSYHKQRDKLGGVMISVIALQT